jgi:hypothetical protein
LADTAASALSMSSAKAYAGKLKSDLYVLFTQCTLNNMYCINQHLDDNYIFVLDNGRGMSSRQLNNWAVYRLSKFIRKERKPP